MKQEEIKYHKALINIIDKFRKPQRGRLVSKTTAFNGLKAQFKPFKSVFKIKFHYDVFSKRKMDLDVGQNYKKVESFTQIQVDKEPFRSVC